MRHAKWTTMLTVVLFLLLAAGGAMAAGYEDARFISPSEVNLENWMTLIPDEALITEINIPGTHDSGTAHMNWVVSDTMASCHDWTIAEQLEHGLRVFDIRLAVDRNHPDWLWMELSHSVWRCALNGYPNSPILMFRDVITDCASFLKSHGNETIVLCLSSEDLKDETRPLIAKLREEYRYTKHRTLLNTYDVPLEVYVSGDPIPVLGHARGRIIVIDDEAASDMTDKKQGARFSYEMHYDEDTLALRAALYASAATPITYAIAREAYFADVISLKKGFMNKFFQDAEQASQQYTNGHGTTPGVFVNEGYENEDGKYGEPGLKYSGTNLNTAGKYLGPLSPTIREYAIAINNWLKNHAWKNGARYGWVTMDYPIDALTKNIIATNEIITTKVFVKGVWGDGFATRPDIGDEFIIDGKKYVRDHDDALTLSPETADKLENGALTLELAPSSPLYSREYPVTTRIEHVGMDYWVVWVYPEVRVTIDWDYVSPLDSETLKDGFFIAKYENGDEVPVTASHVRVQKNEKDGTVVYLNVQPIDNKRGAMTLDINPAVLDQHKAYKYNAATDRVKRNEYGTNWGFTLRTSAAQYDFTGKITFNDNNNAGWIRPGHTSVFLVATGHAPGRTVSDEDPVLFREYQQLEINDDQPTWIFHQLPMWVPNSDGSKQYDLNWELSFGNAGGYIVDIDYSQIQNHRIDSTWTAHPTSSVEIRWVGDEADTSYRPDKIGVSLRRKSTGKWISDKYVSPSTQWRTSFTSIDDDDWTLSLSNVYYVYYEATGPFVTEDKLGAYFICKRRDNTQINAKLHWYDGRYYGSHPAVNVSLLNGTTVVDKYEAGIYDDNNTAFFGTRPTKDSSGKPITYTVQAALANNNDYIVYVQGFDIILVRKQPLTGFIYWFDAAGTQIERPEWVTDDQLKLELWRMVYPAGRKYEPTDLKPTITPIRSRIYADKYDYSDLPAGVVGQSQHSTYRYNLQMDISEIPGAAIAFVTESKNVNIRMAPVLAHVPFTIRVTDNGYHPAQEFMITLKDSEKNQVASMACAVGQNIASAAFQLDFMVNSMKPGTYSLTMEPVGGNWTHDSAVKSFPLTVRYNSETNAVEAIPSSNPEFNVSYKHEYQPVQVAVRFPVHAVNQSQSEKIPDNTVFRFVPFTNGKKGSTLSMHPGETICLSTMASQPGEIVFTVDQNPGNDLRWQYDTAPHILRVGVKDNGSGVLIPDYADGDELVFENIYVGSTVRVSGLVMWNEQGVKDHSLRPEKVTLELVYYYSEEYMKEHGLTEDDIQVLATKEIEVTDDDSQFFDFGPQVHITPSGELKFYSVREKPIDNYKTTMNYNGYSVLNTPVRDVSVTVVWNDEDNRAAARPGQVKMRLLGDNMEEFPAVLSKAGNWQYTYADLPMYRADHSGDAVDYLLMPEVPDGYISAVTGDVNSGFVVTYTAMISVSGSVDWENGKRPANNQPIVQLLRNGQEIGQPVEEQDFKYAFINLPIADAQNVPYEYNIVATLEGFDVTITNQPVTRDAYGNVTVNAIISKKDVPVYAEIPVNLTFSGVDASAVMESFCFILERSDVNSPSRTLVELNKENNFADFFVLDASGYEPGKPYSFTVHQLKGGKRYWIYDERIADITITIVYINGMPVAQVSTDEKGLTFRNVYCAMPGSISIELDKQIVNLLDGIELPNQQTFQFELLKPQDGGNAARVSNVTLTGEGHVQFPPLALTDVGTYTYLVREYSDDAPGWVFDHTGYPVKVTVSDVNGQLQATADVIPTITNIFETTILNVGVKVKWVDNNTKKKPIPRYVQVELFADGKSAGQAHPSQKSNWMASFAEMPEYRRANTARAVQMVPVVYTLTADEVKDFTVCITGDAKSGYVVTYSAIPDIPETGDRMNLPLVAGMLLMSMSMLIVLVHKRKRN